MRLANTVVVALQASMVLAIVIPNKDIKKDLEKHEGKISEDAKPDKNFYVHEKITKVTTHRLYGPKDHKHYYEVKENHDKDGHQHKSKEHDVDDEKEHPHYAKKKDHNGHSHEAKEKEHKYKHSHKTKEEDDDDDDDNEGKEYKPVSNKPDTKKGTKSDIHDIVLEPPKSYKTLKHEHQHKHRYKYDHEHEYEHHDVGEHEGQEKKGKFNSKDGKKYKFIHRKGKNSKREVDINIHAPSYEVYPVSDKHHGYGNAKLVKIVRVSTEGSHEIKHPEHKHDGEKKHIKITTNPKRLHQHVEFKHHGGHDEHHKDQYHKGHYENEKKLLRLLEGVYSHHEAGKDHHVVPKPQNEHIKSKHYDNYDKDGHGNEKKHPRLSEDHQKADRDHRHSDHESQDKRKEFKHAGSHHDAHHEDVPEMSKALLDMVRELYSEPGKHKTSYKPAHQYKPQQSHDHLDRDHTSHHDKHHHDEHHDDKKKYSKPAKDYHHQDEPKYGYKESEHAEYKQDNENKHTKLIKNIKSEYKPSYKNKVAEHPDYPHRPRKHTEEPKDHRHLHHESKKVHSSYERPSYQDKEHVEYKHDDEKKHTKLSKDRSSQHKPTYQTKEHDRYHDDEEKHHDYLKKKELHHDEEAEHHSDHKKSKDHLSDDKPSYRYKHDDDKKYGKSEKEHNAYRKPIESRRNNGLMDFGKWPNKDKHSSYKPIDFPGWPSYPLRELPHYRPNRFDKGGHKGSDEHNKHKYDDTLNFKNKPGVPHTKRSDKFDPNAPLPRLKTLHILNIEALKPEDRKRIAFGLPLDEATRKEFGEFKECSPELIAKLNTMYAEIIDDPKYRHFIKYINTERKMIGGTGKDRKRSTLEISPQALKKIESMEPNLRRLAAQKLDFPPKLVEEFTNCGKLSPGMIEKLNKEYERVHDKPKYAKIISKLKSESKRSPPKISSATLAKIETMEPSFRRLAAEELDFPSKLAEEFANCGKLSHGMIEKLNIEYARIYNNPKYVKIIEQFSSKSKRSKSLEKDREKNKDQEKNEQDEPKKLTEEQLKKIGRLPRVFRSKAAQRLNFPKDLRKEFARKKTYTGQLLDRLNKEWARVQKDPQYKKIVEKIMKMDQRKRSVHQLSEQQVEKLVQLSKYDRQAIARKLDLDKSLTHEFVNTYKSTPILLEKLNEAYAKIVSTPEQEKLLKLLDGKLSKRGDWIHFDRMKYFKTRLDSIPPHVRLRIAQQLDLQAEDKKELLKVREPSPTLLDKIKLQLIRNVTVLEHREQLFGLIRWADSLKPKPLLAKVWDPDYGRRVKRTDEKLKEKLKKTKENGWCKEFVGELENTWDDPAEKTESKVDKKEGQKE
ncbi:hypothetical protein FBEOM_8301 [Fusarium beomiforme]|uniref:Uncharacterized protein n=1 Tax=Fusarium beomiforme TaxID=44412 RepID=A0A9P5DUF2_9HYPO|nr:hypothetical protein FBEOM_8301 [Fusarium beomiforme]